MSCPAHDLAKSRRMLVVEDVDLIQKAVYSLHEIKQLRVMELGTGSGTSALAVLCARLENVKIFSIDNSGEGSWGELAVSNIGRAKDFQLIAGGSKERLIEVLDESVDLLIMDASHKADSLRDEFKAWLSAVKPGGLIWVHDYGDPEKFGLHVEMTRGVKRTVDALVKREELEEVEVAGLGWLGRKPEVESNVTGEPETEETEKPFADVYPASEVEKSSKSEE